MGVALDSSPTDAVSQGYMALCSDGLDLTPAAERLVRGGQYENSEYTHCALLFGSSRMPAIRIQVLAFAVRDTPTIFEIRPSIDPSLLRQLLLASRLHAHCHWCMRIGRQELVCPSFSVVRPHTA